MNEMRAVEQREGYLPIEDHGLIGDGRTCALVARDGAISWMCLPRFDRHAFFARLLDRENGGCFLLAPEDLQESRQYYIEDTGVLVTEMRGAGGTVAVTDALLLREDARLEEAELAARGELLRCARVLDGQVRLRVHLDPRGGAGASRRGDKLRVGWAEIPALPLYLLSSQPLEGLETSVTLQEGQELWLLLRWNADAGSTEKIDPQRLLQNTVRAWRQWASKITYGGPQERLVRRSALTLKLLGHSKSGAIMAASCSSLPEAPGGERNWDYRYVWLRDAALSVLALRGVGLGFESDKFLTWVVRVLDKDKPRVLYDLDGSLPKAEYIDQRYKGYRESAPVRWGNAAADQPQNDMYGEILDCAYRWAERKGSLDDKLWQQLTKLVETARQVYDQPDHGIWEVRSPPDHPYTYSVGMCQVALDRAARIAARLGLPADAELWAAQASELRHRILTEAWDEKQQSITEHLGPDGGLDSSVLALPLRRVFPANHPRMVATTRAVADRLSAGGGLLYRYLPKESPDGLAGEEGAFLICSFWLVENLVGQDALDQAGELYESLCARANPLGLLSEQIDAHDGSFLSNFPQALSHVGLISAGVALDQALDGRGSEPSARSRLGSSAR
jgi:alpha,alpha-trehalase